MVSSLYSIDEFGIGIIDRDSDSPAVRRSPVGGLFEIRDFLNRPSN
jgi:hypothetical protein